jgi:hypothetical protein
MDRRVYYQTVVALVYVPIMVYTNNGKGLRMHIRYIMYIFITGMLYTMTFCFIFITRTVLILRVCVYAPLCFPQNSCTYIDNIRRNVKVGDTKWVLGFSTFKLYCRYVYIYSLGSKKQIRFKYIPTYLPFKWHGSW